MSLNDGHRERLSKKVNDFGLDSLEPHEQLEYLLFSVIRRGDTNKTAHRIMDKYGTLGAVLNANASELAEIAGVGVQTARFLTSLPCLLGIVERSIKFEKKVELFDYIDIIRYCRTFFYGRMNEAVYMFSLNSAYKLLTIHKVGEGIAGEVHAFPTQIAKQAILDNASAVVIAHNHPNGESKASKDDLKLSRDILDALAGVGIDLRDSVIIAKNRYFSLRKSGYLDRNQKKRDDTELTDEEISKGEA